MTNTKTIYQSRYQNHDLDEAGVCYETFDLGLDGIREFRDEQIEEYANDELVATAKETITEAGETRTARIVISIDGVEIEVITLSPVMLITS